MKNYSLTKRENHELKIIRNKIRGTPIKVSVVRGTGNIKIFGGGFSPVYKGLTNNVGVSTKEVVRARVFLFKKGWK